MICINVGGVIFYTSETTLKQYTNFFYGLVQAMKSDDEVLFIDRDPTHFRYVLNWLRGSRELPEDSMSIKELIVEANFYCMPDMVDALHRYYSTSSTILLELQKISKYIQP